MKKLLTLLFLAMLLAPAVFAEGQQEEAAPAAPVVTVDTVEEAGLAYFADKPSHSYMVGTEDAIAAAAAGGTTILDIRRADDYAAGHLKGAVNIPWGPALAEKLTSIPQGEEVLLYCYSGQTAGQAVALLNMAGVQARSVKYGWNFGLSKTEGIEAVTETAVNELPAGSYDVDEQILEAYTAYYADFANTKGTPFASNIVSEDNAKAIFDAKDDSAVFVSIRKPEDFAAGHIEGAINLPYGNGFADLIASLPMDKKVIVYCYSGQTAGQTVGVLRMMGYDAVSLKGGMGTGKNKPLGWTAKGFPVVQ